MLKKVNSPETADHHRSAILESRAKLEELREKTILQGEPDQATQSRIDSHVQHEIDQILSDLQDLSDNGLHQYGFQPDLRAAVLEFMGMEALMEITRLELEQGE